MNPSAEEVIKVHASRARRVVTPGQARQRHSRATGVLRHCLVARAWCRTRIGRATVDALADIPPLCDEIERLDATLACSRRRHQDLTAAARATLAADAEGEPDPLYYLRDELGSREAQPSDGERSW